MDTFNVADSWLKCDVEIWDYEKTFYQVRLTDGSLRWAYPNAGHLIDAGFEETSGSHIPIEDVSLYREAEDEYFDYLDNRER